MCRVHKTPIQLHKFVSSLCIDNCYIFYAFLFEFTKDSFFVKMTNKKMSNANMTLAYACQFRKINVDKKEIFQKTHSIVAHLIEFEKEKK